MKYTFRFFALAVLAAVALTSRAQEVKITGYQPGYYVVTSDMEHQLNANVIKPINSAIAHAGSGDLQIFVKGYADKTGSGKENQGIALTRAEQVKEFLLEQFPKATITNRTKGDDANVRMVMISWKITPVAPVSQQKKSDSGMIVLVAIIGIVIFIIIAFAARPKTAQLVQLVPPPPQVMEVIPVAAKPTMKEIVHVKKDGNIYDVPIELKDGMWHTPFPSVRYPTKVEFRKDPRDAVKIIKSYMADKNGYHATTIKQLIANGTIKVVQAQGEAS